ncbi:ABC-ATPase domain-containing protein [Psychromicrobium xiongbiense]|uniref:ABC-ATPase domain-containing protein n=1 Tax=Psychromicrobium xiongbiense TaxID=3051184 RepID=UPI0025558918|nr:ABC-ATPase domain-containing protein [Psychromicrobium sp. YIM S02556]
MRDFSTLDQTLNAIDGRGYSSYKQLLGRYNLAPGIELAIDRVQVDPYAPPSLMRIIVNAETAGFPADLLETRVQRIAVSDFLTRRFAQAIHQVMPAASGHHPISIGHTGQQVLERTNVLVSTERVEARIAVSLPASGRRIRGREAARLLTEVLPRIASQSLLYTSLDRAALREQVDLLVDQESLRGQLKGAGLVSFVGDGAILPRRSGDSDRPLEEGAVPFQSPESLKVSFEVPSGRQVTGMGIPEGITVIVGGGYHGKSTLLRAIERGVYPHLGSDGREWVITRPDAVTIRAEDGRSVTGVDIAPFINNLPSGSDTRAFSTTNASGSTSQASNLSEALEAGTSALLIDEDTSATNFMIRDHRMRELIPADREPITPFVDRVRPLLTEKGVSTVLVAGGSGAFFDVADHVIAMDSYVPRDVTEQARSIAAGETGPDAADAATAHVFNTPTPRVPARQSLHPAQKTKPAKARSAKVVQYGREDISLEALPQLVDSAQTTAIARALDRLAELCDNQRSVSELVGQITERIDRDGLDALSTHGGHPGFMTRPRPQEIAAALNRYRRLELVKR